MPKCTCGKQASFNFPNEKKGLFCSTHKDADMVNVLKKMCEIVGCHTVPIYNILGETKGRFCIEHKQPDMIDVINKRCEADGCFRQPSYNIRGETKGRFCIEHKQPEMIDVINKRCEANGCEKRPSYNIRGETNSRFCEEHKEPNMINVKSKKCEENGCDIIPTYNVLGETKGRFCVEHKEPHMVDVKSKKCEHDKCIKQPQFNVCGEKKGRFCYNHKQPDMVNVKSIRCKYDRCNTRAWYGMLGKGITHCASHTQKGMIRYPNRTCSSCKQLGTHEANGARFCEEHKPVDAENLGIATCSMCGLDDILTNGKCGTCDPHVIQVRRHAKENRVKDFLIASGITLVHDKMLEGTMCGRERPDFQIDCGTHFVYVEVDEHQHDTYACECEQTRMVNLVEVRGMPVRWIRYNPDTYESQKGQRQVKIEQREKKLLEYVKWAMQHSPQKDGDISSVLYLFYDEYDTTKQPWMKLI